MRICRPQPISVLASFELLGFRLAPLQLRFVKPGAQHVPSRGAVLVLGALRLAGDDDAGGNVGEAHGAIGLVDVLAAGAGRAISVGAHVLFD